MANRALFARSLGARPVFLQQVHGQQVAVLTADTPDGTQADGCVTTAPGVACTIMVADCLPVLFATPDGARRRGRARRLARAGGAGRAAASSSRCLRSLAAAHPVAPRDVLAWLGPCIGPDAFEVGPEVKAAFEAHDPQASTLFKPHGPGKWLADLPGLARRRLAALGITRIYGNDGSRAWCTVSNPSRFFSHRRDRVSGRFAAASGWLDAARRAAPAQPLRAP